MSHVGASWRARSLFMYPTKPCCSLAEIERFGGQRIECRLVESRELRCPRALGFTKGPLVDKSIHSPHEWNKCVRSFLVCGIFSRELLFHECVFCACAPYEHGSEEDEKEDKQAADNDRRTDACD